MNTIIRLLQVPRSIRAGAFNFDEDGKRKCAKEGCQNDVRATYYSLVWLPPILVRPITFTQIYDLGSVSKDMPEVEQQKIDGRTNVSATLMYYEEASRMSEIAVMTIFRSVWMRKLFRKYIKKRLTVHKYKKLQDYMAQTMDANFF